MPRRLAWLVVALAVPGCSLVFDFSQFPSNDEDGGALDVSMVDGGARDVGETLDAPPGMDGGGMDAPLTMVDAPITTDMDAPAMDVRPGLDGGADAGRDTGVDAPPPDAPRRDAGMLDACTGLSGHTDVPLGDITAALPSPIGNTELVVRSVGQDLGAVWRDGTNNIHLRAWTVDGDAHTATELVGDHVIGSAGVGASLALGRDGSSWVVWTSAARLRCPGTGTGACGTEPAPPDGNSPYAFAQGPTTFAWVYSSAGIESEWRAARLGATSPIVLATQPGHIVTPDAVGIGGTRYVAVVADDGAGEERAALVWFDTSAGTPTLARSTIGPTVNRIYVTYDATSGAAYAVAAAGPPTSLTSLIVSPEGSTIANVPLAWPGSSPRPIVSRGDGTIWVHDGTRYGLRSTSTLTSTLAMPGDPGAFGAGVVADAHYAYFAVVDASPDRMVLRIHDCL